MTPQEFISQYHALPTYGVQTYTEAALIAISHQLSRIADAIEREQNIESEE